MLHQGHLAVYWKPVGMDVEQTHENGHHDATVVEILILVNLLDNDHAAVGGSDNKVRRVVYVKNTDGATEKIQNDAIEDAKDNGKTPKWKFAVE
jgi:hypothetical protein